MRLLILLLAFVASSASAGTLLCLGDSQTSARSPLVASDTYCAKMAAATGRAFINKGLGNDTTDGALARLTADVLSQPAECVAVMLGANDGFIDTALSFDISTYWTAAKPAHSTPAHFKDNLVQIIAQIEAAGKEVTLITPWAFWATTNLLQYPFYVDAVFAAGAQMNVPVIDAYAIQLNLWWASQPWNLPASGAPSMWAMQTDYQHPNAYGHTLIARECQKPRYASACACRP